MYSIEEYRTSSHTPSVVIPRDAVREYGRDRLISAVADDEHRRRRALGSRLVGTLVRGLGRIARAASTQATAAGATR